MSEEKGEVRSVDVSRVGEGASNAAGELALSVDGRRVAEWPSNAATQRKRRVREK